jgi:uncharacterized protein YjcR
MANQYTGSFEHKVKEKFNCSALELLKNSLNEDLTYFDLQEKLGVTHGTIRKWARRYGISLRSGSLPEKEDESQKMFYEDHLNMYNLLSRRWA